MANIKKNYIWNTAYQVLNLIIPLITAPYLSRVLGAEGIGIQSYTASIVSYFVLFATLGTSLFGQRNISFVQNNREERSRSFFETFIFRAITTSITLIVYLAFAFNSSQYKVFYLILSGQLLNIILDISWFFQGMEKFKSIVVRNIIVRICNILFIFIFVKEQNDLALYILSSIIFSAVANLAMWLSMPKYICFVRNIRPFRDFKDIILLFLPSIATQVYTVLDKSMIGWFTGSEYQNGCYEQAERIARMALAVVTSISTVLIPRISNLFKEKNSAAIREYTYKGYRFVWIVSIPIMFGIIGISDIFVPVFFGEGYDMAIPLMKIFSVLVVAVGLASVTGVAYLIPTMQQNVYTVTVTISAIFNLILNFMLIPYIGAIGAAIASVGAEIIGAALQIAYCCRKGQLKLGMIFASVWKYIVAGIIMLLMLLWLNSILSATVMGLLIMIASGACTYFVILLILRDRFLIDNIKSVTKHIFSKIKNKI